MSLTTRRCNSSGTPQAERRRPSAATAGADAASWSPGCSGTNRLINRQGFRHPVELATTSAAMPVRPHRSSCFRAQAITASIGYIIPMPIMPIGPIINSSAAFFWSALATAIARERQVFHRCIGFPLGFSTLMRGYVSQRASSPSRSRSSIRCGVGIAITPSRFRADSTRHTVSIVRPR
jgi:hypothetical protein